MSSSERIEFSDMSKFGSNTELTSNKSTSDGFYISTAKALILVLLAIFIAVGIGIIVHFAGGGKEIVCQCSPNKDNGIPSADRITDCRNWALGGNTEICTACPKDMTIGSTMAPLSTSTKAPSKQKVDVRLPMHMEPLFYEVELQPNMYNNQPETFTFDGFVRVKMVCRTPSNNITLQINKLSITENSMKFMAVDGTASAPRISSWKEDKLRQFLIVSLDGMMVEGGTYSIEMRFVGPLKDDLAGLYLSQYMFNNQPSYIATTQLQPTDARKVFPCFDEPAIKAQFNITLVRKSNLISISNMPITRSVPRANDMIADIYQTTPKMSTYLLAFIVGDLDKINKTTTNNIVYGAWSTKGKIDQATYALDVGVDILTYFEKYFEIPFPLPKQDMVAIPDFSAGAMENWGLIIYRETAMLYKPGVSSEGNKQRVAVVVSHELAHQWFGNLVTPSWWDDLWLNEGFASFVEYMGVDHVHPDWKMFDQFIVDDLQDVFDFDGLTTSHPVYVPVGHPDEINEIFDRISYAKGASIIRMMRFFLGENTFRLGLKRYLNSREYDAAFHDDLWSSLTEQYRTENKTRDLDVKQIMDTWTLQMNYPVVTVSREGSGKLRLTQQRYLRDPAAVDPMKYISPFDYKWYIPFTYTTNIQPNYNQTDADVVWIRPQDDTLVIDSPNLPAQNNNNWILGNVQQYGYYRVNYDSANWQALINQLNTNHMAITSINRAQIINDAWNLAAAGHVEMKIALGTVEYLANEMEYVPRTAARRQLAFVERMLSKSDIYGQWQKFMLSRVREPFETLTLNNTGATHLESYMRSIVVTDACDYGLPECVGNATQMFKQWMMDPVNNQINPGLKTKVYCIGVQYGGIEEWEFVFDQYMKSEVAAEKSRLLQAMACTQEPWIRARYLTKAIHKSDIRKQDTLNVIIFVSRQTSARAETWNFVRENWRTISDDFSVSLFSFSNMIGQITNAFNTNFELQQLQEFIESQDDLGSGERAFQQAVEKTKANIKWMENNYGVVKEWLEDLNLM